MKRKIFAMIAVTLAASVMLFGCSSTSNSKKSNKKHSDKNVEKVEDEDDEDEAPSKSKEEIKNEVESDSDVLEVIDNGLGYNTIEEYFALPEIAAIYEEATSNMASDGSAVIKSTLEAVDNDVTWSIYTTDEYMELFLEDPNGTFTMSTDGDCKIRKQMLYNECGIEPSSYTVIYYSESGKSYYETVS